jgi:hypothetical protein
MMTRPLESLYAVHYGDQSLLYNQDDTRIAILDENPYYDNPAQDRRVYAERITECVNAFKDVASPIDEIVRLRRIERDYDAIRNVPDQIGGNVEAALKLLGVEPAESYQEMGEQLFRRAWDIQHTIDSAVWHLQEYIHGGSGAYAAYQHLLPFASAEYQEETGHDDE